MAEVQQLQAMEEHQSDKLPDIADTSGNVLDLPTTDEEQTDRVTLPSIHRKEIDSSTESLIKALGLTGTDEKSLGRLLKTVRGQVLSTLDELRTITTHDDNLEKQYKEVVTENVQLNSALEKAKGEIRHLKGQLSVLQMTSPEIMKHKARNQLRERRRQDHEHQLQQTRQKYAVELMPLLDFTERARTVNARGEYIDNRQPSHSRHSSYPPPHSLPTSTIPMSSPAKFRTNPLPPPLLGCRCSVCSAQQSLGALTIGSKQPLLSQSTLHRSPTHLTKSGQQILLGDRVIIRGERPGVVRYIGRLESDIKGQLFIGVHLVMPVGTCDGSLRGHQYFQCPQHHGVFVKPTDVMCVTGRKPCTGGTVIPRIQEKITLGTGKYSSKLLTPPSTRTASTMTQARALLQEELAQANTMSTSDELFDPSVQEMRRRMDELSRKNKLRLASQQQQSTQETAEQETSPIIQTTTPSPVQELNPDTEPSPKPVPTPPPSNPQPSVPPSPSPSIPPIPPTPTPPPPEVVRVTTPPPSRSETPLPTMLLRELQSKDLGNTGFVTGNELLSDPNSVIQRKSNE